MAAVAVDELAVVIDAGLTEDHRALIVGPAQQGDAGAYDDRLAPIGLLVVADDLGRRDQLLQHVQGL